MFGIEPNEKGKYRSADILKRRIPLIDLDKDELDDFTGGKTLVNKTELERQLKIKLTNEELEKYFVVFTTFKGNKGCTPLFDLEEILKRQSK